MKYQVLFSLKNNEEIFLNALRFNYTHFLKHAAYTFHKISESSDAVSISTICARDEKAEFAKSVDPDEVTHNEPPYLDLHWLPSSL